MRKRSVFIALCLAYFAMPLSTVAQQHPTLIWGSLGIGGAGMNNESSGMLGGSLRAVCAWDHLNVSATVQSGTTINIFGTGDNVSAFSFCVGSQLVEDLYILRAAVGPAYLHKERTNTGLFTGTTQQFSFGQFGLCAEAEILAKNKFLGFGLGVSFAMAKDITMGSIMATFSFGKLE